MSKETSPSNDRPIPRLRTRPLHVQVVKPRPLAIVLGQVGDERQEQLHGLARLRTQVDRDRLESTRIRACLLDNRVSHEHRNTVVRSVATRRLSWVAVKVQVEGERRLADTRRNRNDRKCRSCRIRSDIVRVEPNGRNLANV